MDVLIVYIRSSTLCVVFCAAGTYALSQDSDSCMEILVHLSAATSGACILDRNDMDYSPCVLTTDLIEHLRMYV